MDVHPKIGDVFTVQLDGDSGKEEKTIVAWHHVKEFHLDIDQDEWIKDYFDFVLLEDVNKEDPKIEIRIDTPLIAFGNDFKMKKVGWWCACNKKKPGQVEGKTQSE